VLLLALVKLQLGELAAVQVDELSISVA